MSVNKNLLTGSQQDDDDDVEMLNNDLAAQSRESPSKRTVENEGFVEMSTYCYKIMT